MGQDLEDLGLEELSDLEQKMDASLGLVRKRKVGVWNIYFNSFDISVHDSVFPKFFIPFSFLPCFCFPGKQKDPELWPKKIK